MTERLVTDRELRDLLARLTRMEQRVSRVEVVERLTYTPPTSYTPTYTGATTPGVTTYTTQVGTWVRLGRVIIATGTVVWTAATGTGAALVSLPFTAANVANQNYGGSLRISAVTFANSTPEILLQPNTNVFLMSSPLTNVAPTNVAIEAAGSIVFTVTYFVD